MGGMMPCVWRLCAWLALTALLLRFIPEGQPGMPYGLMPFELFLLTLIPMGAESVARRRGPRWAFSIYGAIGGAFFASAAVAHAEPSFREFSDRRATTIAEYLLFWAALMAGMAYLCRVIGSRSAPDADAGPEATTAPDG